MKSTSPIDLLVRRDRQARLWLGLLAFTTAGFAFERHHLVVNLKRQPQVLIVDDTCYYLPKNLDFESATELHSAQTTLAMEALFNRHPKGPDHPDRLERLFEEEVYRQAIRDLRGQAEEFAAKELHQKVELGLVKILQVRDHAVLTAVSGQLIRTGIFEGKTIVEVLEIKARFKFILNTNMATNGRYPTLVSDYDVVTKPRAAS